jgi:hypothetical protein
MAGDRPELCCEYNPDTGVIIRNGRVLGTLRKDGYLKAAVLGKQWLLHRLAWFLATGEQPPLIDHINGNKTDNRLKNLRPISKSGNAQNMRKISIRNKTGYLGVSVRKNKFHAAIKVNGKQMHLGYYDTPEEAHKVYLRAKHKYHEYHPV